jgi:hypothetical protein
VRKKSCKAILFLQCTVNKIIILVGNKGSGQDGWKGEALQHRRLEYGGIAVRAPRNDSVGL